MTQELIELWERNIGNVEDWHLQGRDIEDFKLRDIELIIWGLQGELIRWGIRKNRLGDIVDFLLLLLL